MSFLSLSHGWRFEEDSDTPITPFTEDKGYATTPDEIKEAEKEIQEEEQDETSADDIPEDELRLLSPNALSRVRFTPRMEYGTPSGIEPPCPSCADAGDVAIIDAELAPSDETDTDEFGEESSAEGIVTDDESLEMELRKWDKLQKEFEDIQNAPAVAFLRYTIPGTEDFSDLIDGFISILKNVMIKVAKYTRKAYIFCRDRVSRSFMRLSTVSKLWNIKLKMNLDKVDVERLQRFELEAFPYSVWIDISKLALSAFDMVSNANRIVFDVSEEATTSMMKRFAASLKNNGVEFNVTKNSIDMDDLLDKRVYTNVIDLGFTKAQIGNCMRYLSNMSKCVPNAKENKLQPKTDALIKEITNKSAKVNQAVEEGQLKKNSSAYQEEVEKIMHYTIRLDFVLMCMRCAYGLFDILTKDILKVFNKYEDAYAIKELVD